MIFGTTAYFLGLLAIAIPIVIHLWSKKTRKTIPFGTIRFLSEDDTQAIKSLIPTEWLLLSLRIMIFVILVLIMSEPLWNKSAQKTEIVLIDPDYENHPNFNELIDSLQENTDVRWFSQGFPVIEDSVIHSDISHWDLLRDLRRINAGITIISPRRLSQYAGVKPPISTVNWVSLPQDIQTFVLGDFKSGAGSVSITGTTDLKSTQFSHAVISGSSANDSLVVTVAIQSDDAFAELHDFIRASIEAINEDSPLQISVVADSHAEWLIWLKDEPAPNRRNLLYATTISGQELINQVSLGVFTIAAFQLESFLAYNFPIRLEQVLGQSKIDITGYDWRQLPESQLPEQALNTATSSLEVTESFSHWLWGLLLIILMVERYLSLKTTAA